MPYNENKPFCNLSFKEKCGMKKNKTMKSILLYLIVAVCVLQVRFANFFILHILFEKKKFSKI